MSKAGWILIGGMVILLIIIFLVGTCDTKKPDIDVSQGDSLQYWKNKAGEIASLKKKEADYFAEEKKGWLDSIAKLHNTKTKYIKEVITVTTEGKVEIVNKEIPVIKYVDSNNCPRILWQMFENAWYIAEVTLDTQGDSTKLLIESRDSLTIVAKTVREGGLFNRKEFLQFDFQNTNPYNHIQGATVYRVPHKTNAWNKWIKPALAAAVASGVTYQLTKK